MYLVRTVRHKVPVGRFNDLDSALEKRNNNKKLEIYNEDTSNVEDLASGNNGGTSSYAEDALPKTTDRELSAVVEYRTKSTPDSAD